MNNINKQYKAGTHNGPRILQIITAYCLIGQYAVFIWRIEVPYLLEFHAFLIVHVHLEL